MNRITAKILCLIQWSRFQNIQVKLEGSTLFTGVNGSGKSTILDAVTYLLTGNTQFNKAAKDRDRTVTAYVRGDTKSNGKNRYLRSGEVISYAAMEFYSPIDDSNFVVGVCMESPNETDCKSYWFVLPETEMADVKMAEVKDGRLHVFSRNQLLVKGTPMKSSAFMSRDKGTAQVMRALGLRCDVAKYRGKLLKMMAFHPENNVDQFIQECVLEAGKADSLKELREQKLKFEQLREMFENLRSGRRRLEELETKTVEYEKKEREYRVGELMLSYQHVCEKEKEKEENILKIEELQDQLSSLEKRKKGIEDRLEQANKRLQAANGNDYLKGPKESIEELKKQLDKLAQEIISNEEAEAKLMKLKGQIAALETWMGEKVDFLPEDIQNISILHEANLDEDSRRKSFLRISKKILNYKEWLGEQRVHIKDEVEERKRNTVILEEQIKALEANKLILPPDVEKAKKVIREEFRKKGIDTEIRVFAELVKGIKEEAWRSAIETFLGRKRFYIIVDGKYCAEAMWILQERELYHVNVVITDKLPKMEIASGSAAEMLDIPNVFARRYANYLLNGIHLCNTLEELHENPKGGLMRNGMLAKSFSVSKMDMGKTRYCFGADAVRLQLEQLREEQREENRLLRSSQEKWDKIQGWIKEIEEVDWKAEDYDFGVPEQLKKNRESERSLRKEKEAMESDPSFMAVLEEFNQAQKQYEKAMKDRDEMVGSICVCREELENEIKKEKSIAGQIYLASREYEEVRENRKELEPVMLEQYEKMRIKADSYNVITEKKIRNLETERNNCIREMENLQMNYAKLAEIDLNRRGVSFISFYRGQLKEISNVKLEEISSKLEEQSRTLESAFMNDFVAELNEMILNAKAEIELINRELKRLPFGSDTYRFVMEEKPDRREFFRICRKIEAYGSAEFYLGGRMDEELEHDIRDFMDLILEEEDETEYTDYRKYFVYDMKISSCQGNEEIEADLSKKQGSASNGEKQTPYFIILAASLMQCYPRDSCCVRLAFIDEAFSALSRERIEQMVKYFEENHFQVIYAAPPEKISSIGMFIQSTVSLVITGRYTNTIEGLVKKDEFSV